MIRGALPGAFVALACTAPVGAQVDLGGWAEYQAIAYGLPGGAGSVGRNQLRVQPELTGVFGSWGRGFVAVELRADASAPSRDRIWIDEAYLEVFLGSVDVRAGRQFVSWGRADALNPTDYFGAQDYSDVLDADQEALAQDAISLTWYLGDVFVEAVWAPLLRPSFLPAPGSRWWPSGPGAAPEGIDLGEARFLSGGKGALGVRSSATFRGWDTSLSLYRGPWSLPALGPAGPSAAFPLAPDVPGLWAVGADAATVIGGVGVHGEAAAYTFRTAGQGVPGLDQPFLRYVLGGDYVVRGLPGDRPLSLLAEWAQDVPLRALSSPWSTLDLNHVFRGSLLARADLQVTDDTRARVEGARAFGGGGWVAVLELESRPRDGLEIRISADLPGGGGGTFFGMFRANRRVHARVRLTF